MGFDVWDEGGDETAYLESCKSSKKYKLGEWHGLEVDGILVSSLIVFRNEWGLKSGYVGIGSVCTSPSHRRMGYATALIKHCLTEFQASGAKGVYLFSDIDPGIYQRLGFEQVKDYESEDMMFLGLSGGLQTTQPSYF